jgi:hypothetical protein
MIVAGRIFQRDGAIVRQVPDKKFLGPYKAQYGSIQAALKIELCLSYLATCDPGMDKFHCSLRVECPARWRGSREEVLTLEREIIHFDTLIDWLLGMERPVIDALFHDCRESIKDREVMRVLLALVDQIRPLKAALAQEEETRRKMLQ